jgi:mannosyltransferase
MSHQPGFFQRRIQLKGGSSVSVPLGIVLLFPFLVVVLILLLFASSPDSDNVKTMPGAGTPPSIRYVSP